MKKLIRVDNNRIVEIRPIEELDFLKGFIEVEVPKEKDDVEIMMNFIYKDNKFVETTKFVDLEKAKIELDEIKVWLSKNDWIPNKIITKEWKETDQRWTDYLKHRSEKRKRQDELNALINL